MANYVVPSFSYNLCFCIITSSGVLRRLLNRVNTENLEISISFEFISIMANLDLLSNDSNLLRAIKCSKADLGLEMESLDLRDIEISHFNKFLDALKLIFKGNVSSGCHITEVFS